MNKYSPYWILDPLKNEINIRNHGNWSFYTSKEVIDGISPLNDLGDKFYQISHGHVSLYEHCLWIFNNSKFDNENSNKVARVLKSVSETFCNSFLSQTGIIVTHENGDITKQPVTPKHYESIVGENIRNEKLIRIINITENIHKKGLIEYLSIFEYLRETKKSSAFISELTLWSFVEQHWNTIDGDSKLYKSLENLMNVVYIKSDSERIEFEKKLIELGRYITGKENDHLTHIRNSLAHGWFYKQRNTWSQETYELFFFVHEFLHKMVLSGLEKEIME